MTIKKIMTIKKFKLRTDSDPSVGLFPCEWQIEGDFTFEHEAELDNFERNLIEFWQEQYENKLKLINWLYNYFANNEELQCDLIANAGLRFVDKQTNTNYFLTNQNMTPLLEGGMITIKCL